MEKLNYSELLQPAIEKIQKDIEADKRGYDEPSNVLLVLSAQISTEEDGDDEIHISMIGSGTMLSSILMEQMKRYEAIAVILQVAVDSYRKNRK